MEREEDILTMCENQLEFDFSSLENVNEEEESSLLPEGFLNARNHDWIDEEVLFIVVKEGNGLGKESYNLDLCGKKMIDWVLIAGNGCEEKVINVPVDIFTSLKTIETKKPYMAVFYSSTPLLDKQTFYKVMDYFCKNGMNALALPKGYVFKTEFVKNNDTFVSGKVMDFSQKAFYVVDNARALSRVSKYLYDKIKKFHFDNGVIMYGEESIYIDADVEIESGAIIYSNNILKGQTYIGKNAILDANNIISDSIVTQNSYVISSYIEKSKVKEGSSIGPFEKLVNQEG